MTGLPNRFPNNVIFDPYDRTNSTIYLIFNGFNRQFMEDPVPASSTSIGANSPRPQLACPSG